jgi:type IV secretion system protein VirD4
VKEKVQEMLDKEDKDFSGVLSTAKTALTLYSDPLVSRTTSVSDFTIQDLVNHERPVSL